MRWPAVLSLPVLVIAGLATAEADEPGCSSAQVLPLSTCNTTPRQPPVLRQVHAPTVSEKNSDANRIAHLRKAAEHLQAAGLNSLADHIRALLHIPSVGKPSKEPGLTRAPAQVLLHLKLLELDKGKLRRLGLDFSQAQSLEALPGVNGLLEALREDGLVRVLAEPTLVTVTGRPAQLRSGGEILLWKIGPDGKPVQRPEHWGTRVDLVPRLTDKRGLRLELRFEYSEVDRTKTVLVAGMENPAIRKRVVDTTLEMKLGETFALSGPSHAVGGETTGSASMVMVMLVTAEAVEPMAAVQPFDRPSRQ